MAFLTLYHIMTGTEMMTKEITDFVEMAEEYQRTSVLWLKRYVYQINNG